MDNKETEGRTPPGSANPPGSPFRPETPARAGSWLSGLLGDAPVAPGQRLGRLKGKSIRNLVILGLAILLGVALMGLPKTFAPKGGQDQGTAVGGLAGTLGSAALASESTDGSATSPGLPTGSPGVWIGIGDLEIMMENTLERILSRIDGAGEVTVAVSLDTSATYVYGYDQSDTTETTEEHDSNGGSRVATQTDTSRTAVVVSQGGTSGPVVVRVELPPIKGVVVVASGAADSRVKALLSQAVQTLYGVPAHRVAVMAGR